MDSTDEYKQQVENIRQDFNARLQPMLDELFSKWEYTKTNHSGLALKDLISDVHRLTGLLLTFGYKKSGNLMRQLETHLYSSAGKDFGLFALEIEKTLSLFRKTLKNEQLTIYSMELPTSAHEELESTRLRMMRASQTIFLVEDDTLQAQSISLQINHFGYKVEVANSLQALEAMIQGQLPMAIVMDIAFPEGEDAGPRAMMDLHTRIQKEIPVIFTSVRDDFQSRLQAVRAGGEAYFVKPVDIGGLVDELDRLTVQDAPEPFRVMIVDDSMLQAKLSAMYLRRAGMEVDILTDPMDVLPALVNNHPELILMDIYMPDCTGLELAKVIRQMDTMLSIPIVFLSSETDREKQLEAIGLGGDDFLSKPIKPEYLISAVASRIERYRKLRSLMIHDSLTGLLNHLTTEERMTQEMARARRQNSPMAFAMIDLDRFKQINDTYGHSTGDRVLRSLARLLKQRLRKSDIIGRFGGEEFAVIMPDTSAEHAFDVMNELRERFSQIHYYSGEEQFNVTFSCGIAEFPACDTLQLLKDTADQALYKAKGLGRNQSILAENKQNVE